MHRWLSLALCLVLGSLAATAQAQNYTLFESGPVRPLAMSPDGTKLFACNIPDGRLEIFAVSSGGLSLIGSVPVGLEPVAVAARTNGEVWVVNHLSDSISIVDVATQRVTRTLLVGDEPRDIVFAGASHDRAFITTAHRGQNNPNDPQLLEGGVGRSDVWVFEATSLGANLGGTPIEILSLGGDTPRALAATPDGSSVYVAVFHSGDQTTVVPAGVIPTPPPSFNVPDPNQTSAPAGELPTPTVGVMLKYQSGTTWVDVTGATHTGLVQFNLPDHDVFKLDANANPPALTSSFDHVGTILFNMVADKNGNVYVSNTDANNFDRFEASDARFSDPNLAEPNVRGELHHARITILSGSSTVIPRHLNKHIDYSVTASAAVNAASLAIPTDMALKGDGSTLYLAAFGSGEIGVIDTAKLALPPSDPNSFQPNAADHIHLSAGGPGGVVLDEPRNRLYVYTRFDDGISLVDPTAKLEVGHLTVHSPETPDIVNGRHFLYDAHLTSSNGEASCAVCHVFADFDSLAWDLGSPDPNAPLASNFNPFVKLLGGTTGPAITGPTLASFNLLNGAPPGNVDFHPLKGPMTTQTLRGMTHNGPMHWRGDRSGGGFTNGVPNFDGDPNALDPNQAFAKFNPAFESLLGNASQLSPADMASYTNFILKVTMPPNPIRNLDQSLTPAQSAGQNFYLNTVSDTIKTCNGCHTLNAATGAFGTGGLSTFEGLSQHFKVPQLRNAYTKVGMYGMIQVDTIPAHGSSATDQIRGFGYLNDGSVDNVISFLNGRVFTFANSPDPNDSSTNYGNAGSVMRQNVASFVMAFPSDLAPIVGQQVTLTSANSGDPTVGSRITLLETRALTAYQTPDHPNNECDLVVKGTISGVTRGWWMSASNTFTPDSSSDAALTDASLRALASTPGQELTFTCVPPGSGQRLGIDRGGVGDSSQPDGIRDANQCGDVTADGIAGNADVTAERAALAGLSTPRAPGKCNVAGGAGSSPPTCDIVDLVVLRRALANLAPGLSTGCNG